MNIINVVLKISGRDGMVTKEKFMKNFYLNKHNICYYLHKLKELSNIDAGKLQG